MKVPTAIFARSEMSRLGDRDESLDDAEESGLIIGTVIADTLAQGLNEKVQTARRWIIVAVLLVLVGIGIGVMGFPMYGGLAIVGAIVSGILAYRASNRDPDVNVSRVEKRFWTGYLIPQQDGLLVYDGTGVEDETDFMLEQVQNKEKLHAASDTLRSVSTLPPILPADTDHVESDVQKTIDEVNTELSSTNRTEIRAPVVAPDDPLVDGIRTVSAATPATEAPRDVTSTELSLAEAQDQAQRIANLETLAFEGDAEDSLRELKHDGQRAVSQLTSAHEETVDLLNEHIHSVGDTLAVNSYSFYCPHCLEDEIHSELSLTYVQSELRLRCDTCKEWFTRDVEELFVPKHRMKDELVEDVWDQLWIEKDDEKRRIYENIEDQQSELRERELEQKRDAIQNAWNRIKDIRSKIRDLYTQAKAARGAVEETGEVMVKYERLREERKDTFQAEVKEAVDQIEEQTKRAIEDTREFEQQKLKEAEQEANERAELRHAEQRARQKELLATEQGGITGKVKGFAAKIKRRRAHSKLATRREEGVPATEWDETPGVSSGE